jgi:hypothetical protein
MWGNCTRGLRRFAAGLLALACCGSPALPMQRSCEKVLIPGEVSAGHEWKVALGEGWVFRVIPIQSASAVYSGWDLVVDREEGAGFPDALMLSTPPYGSINEREIGTTFGLRAQDAIGWNPRSFRFLTDVPSLRPAQEAFRSLNSGKGETEAEQRLMQLAQRSAHGQFRILDARLTPGVADAAPFAQNWAAQSAKTPHEQDPVPSTGATPLGSLNWMRFTLTLWLPAAWKTPPSLGAVLGACAE